MGKVSQRHAFNGLCLAIVQSDRQAGQIRIRAQAEGVAADEVVVTAESL